MKWPSFFKVKEEHVIEEVTPQIIDALKEDEEYVAVFFAGECADEACKELSTYETSAKRYEILTPPPCNQLLIVQGDIHI